MKQIRYGQWLETNDATKKRCSECDVIHLIAQYPHGNANYCPNCGAIMDKEIVNANKAMDKVGDIINASREIFDGRCPYTGEACTDWICEVCPVEEAEREKFENFERWRNIEVTSGGADK